MITKTTLPLLAVSLLAVSSLSAQDDDGPAISAFGSFDFNSHFMSYGWDVWGGGSDGDLLFQPSFGLDVYLGNGVGVYTGIWMDINEEAPGTITGDVQEIDLFIGTYFSVGDISMDLTYQEWYWASDVERVLDLNIGFDAPFSPYILLHGRIDGNDSGGTPEEGLVIEAGGSYGFDPESTGGIDISISGAIGYIATDDFHIFAAPTSDTGIGYYNIGLDFVLPLGIPEGLGAWDLHAAIDLFHTPDDVVPGNPEETFMTYNLGIGFAF